MHIKSILLAFSMDALNKTVIEEFHFLEDYDRAEFLKCSWWTNGLDDCNAVEKKVMSAVQHMKIVLGMVDKTICVLGQYVEHNGSRVRVLLHRAYCL